jgi:hypothetical protein
MLTAMSHGSPSFERLAPVSDRYASLPVAEAFTWSECAADVPPGEWYMVAFRSIRRAGADEARLVAHDDWAHAEAMDAPGFVHYFRGPTTDGGHCLSFCLWDSRPEARTAAGRPAHAAAAALTHETYASYTLEFHRVRRHEGEGGFTFEPYDTDPPARDLRPARVPRLAPRPAPS